eukprot:scaffold1362_cov95-Pinguiococcus_pyrenoidosus.AAC.1
MSASATCSGDRSKRALTTSTRSRICKFAASALPSRSCTLAMESGSSFRLLDGPKSGTATG